MASIHDRSGGQGFAAPADRRRPVEHFLTLFVTIAFLSASFYSCMPFNIFTWATGWPSPTPWLGIVATFVFVF